MRFRLCRRVFWLVAVPISALALAGGIAYAAIPDSRGVIHTCFKPSDATKPGGARLSVVDSDSGATCKAADRTLTFGTGSGSAEQAASHTSAKTCARDTVAAVIAGKPVCLKVGQRCKRSLDVRYHRYGFHCHANGRLSRGTPSVAVVGAPETVFDWSRDRCEELDIPDLAARAFRDANGQVQLIQAPNRRSIGPDLDHLTHQCDPILNSGHDADPAAFNDDEWISSTWTPDGRTIYALIHDEYHGYEHPGQCPSGDHSRCWYNAVTAAVSLDGGRSYANAPADRRTVATLPFRYDPNVSGTVGMFAPSNIIHAKDGYFYALVDMGSLAPYPPREGACMIRTDNLSDARSWRGWDGSSFAITFVNPYAESTDPIERHFCVPFPHDATHGLGDIQDSITYNTTLQRYVAVGSSFRRTPSNGEGVWGFFFSTSTDLVHWTDRQLLMRATFTYTFKCGDPDPIAYPSILDPKSPSRNFETAGRTAYLYYTVLHYKDCQQTLDRDLVRVPIEFSLK